jgi:hypothetical protein
VALVVLGAEGLSRLYEPDYLVSTRGFHVFSPTYGWAPRKGISVVVDGKQVSFNARGYRGRELPVPKVGDRRRVIVLGDSIAFGLDVSDEETFTHLLDVRDNGIEAGNLAVQGYGSGQELLVLTREGLRYDPDVVVLAFCLSNDFADAVLPVALYDGRTPRPRFRLVGDRLVLDDSNLRLAGPRRVLQWLGDHSHLFNRGSALAPGAEPPAGPHWRERRHEALRDEDYVLRLTLALIRRMDAVCREGGAAFLVAVFPTEFAWREKSWLSAALISSLETDGIAVVDIETRFRALGLSFDAVAFDPIGHLNPAGHSAASDVIEREIASLAPVPRAAPLSRASDRPPDLTGRTALRSR